jgi:hypothetical protein
VEGLRTIQHALTYDEWVVGGGDRRARDRGASAITIRSVPGEIIPGDEFYSHDDKYVNDNESAPCWHR